MIHHSLSLFPRSLNALLILLDFPLRCTLLQNVLLYHHIFLSIDHLFLSHHCWLFQLQFLLLFSKYLEWLIPQIYPRCQLIPLSLSSSFHSLILLIHFQLANLELPQTTKHFRYCWTLLRQKQVNLNLQTYLHCHLEYFLLLRYEFPVLLMDLKCSCSF